MMRHFKQGEWFELRSLANPTENVMLRVTVEILSEDTIRQLYDNSDTIERVVDALTRRGLVIEEFTEVIEL